MNRHLLIEFVTSDRFNVVPACVKEVIVNQRPCGFHQRRLTRTELFINFLERLNADRRGIADSKIFALILFKCSGQLIILAQELIDVISGFHAQCADKHGHRNFAILINADIHDAVDIGFILQPCATVRNHGRGIGPLPCLVDVACVVHTGRTHNLRNNYTLRSVDHKRSRIRHQREFSHVHIILLDFSGQAVAESGGYAQLRGVIGVSFLAFLNRILRLLSDRIGNKFDGKVSGIVRNRGYIPQNLHKSLFQEPLVGFGLHFHKVGQFEVKTGAGK